MEVLLPLQNEPGKTKPVSPPTSSRSRHTRTHTRTHARTPQSLTGCLVTSVCTKGDYSRERRHTSEFSGVPAHCPGRCAERKQLHWAHTVTLLYSTHRAPPGPGNILSWDRLCRAQPNSEPLCFPGLVNFGHLSCFSWDHLSPGHPLAVHLLLLPPNSTSHVLTHRPGQRTLFVFHSQSGLWH